MAPVNAQPVGKVFIVFGTVKAVSPGGVERVLTPNSPVYAHEQIVTGPDGSVSIALADNHGHLDLGRMSDVLLDQDVYGGGHAGTTDAVAEVKDIQAALEQGNIDPTTDLPSAAAGPGVAGAGGAAGGGRQIVVFESDHMEVTPDSGAETSGISRNFLDPPPGGNSEESLGIPPEVPVIPPGPPEPSYLLGSAVVTVDEANLLLGTSPNHDALTQPGTLEQLVPKFDPNGSNVLELTFKDKNGDPHSIVIDNDSTNSIVVQGEYGHLTVYGDGSWTYTLDHNTLDHTHINATGQDDKVNESFSFTATVDGTKIDGEGHVTAWVLDDGPTAGQPHDANLSTTAGDSVTHDLHIMFGADGPHDGSALQLVDGHGDSLIGKTVVDSNGHALTSDGHDLVYVSDGKGGVHAVIANPDGTPSDDVVFSVSVDNHNGHPTYTVTKGESPLDSLMHQVTTDFSQGPDHNGNFEFGDMNVHVTGTYNGNDAPVTSEGGLGVGNLQNSNDHVIGSGDTLTMAFQDKAGHSQTVESAQLTLAWSADSRGGMATWEIYNGDQLVAHGTIVRNGMESSTDLDLQGYGAFDKIVFGIDGVNGKDSLYQIKTVTVDQADHDSSLTYSVLATDGDSDTARTDDFNVTFHTADNATGTEHGGGQPHHASDDAAAPRSASSSGGDFAHHHEGSGDGHYGGDNHDALGPLLGDPHHHHS